MKLVDLNLLLYAYNSGALEHRTASSWLAGVMMSAERVGLSWVTLLGFMRLSTAPRVLADPYEVREAVDIISTWLARDNVAIVSPTDRHWPILSDLLPRHRVRGSLITDAHLAALAIEHGATLCTNDRDFLRFAGLKVEFPLQ